MKSIDFNRNKRIASQLFFLFLWSLTLFSLWMGLTAQFPETSAVVGISFCLIWVSSIFIWRQGVSLKNRTEAPKPLLGFRVLIVEDRLENRELYSQYLTTAGAEVCLKNDGIEALEAILNPFDLILMDIQMPRMNGFEATNKIRSLGYSTPIVALTALKKEHVTSHWKNLGFSEILTKPIASDILIAQLSEVLNNPSKIKGYASIRNNAVMNKNALDKNRINTASENVLAIFKKFAKNLPNEINLLASACKDENSETVLDLCHRLKGTCSNCGFSSLALSLEQLEDIVKSGAKPDAWKKEAASIETISNYSIGEFESLIASKEVEIPVHAP